MKAGSFGILINKIPSKKIKRALSVQTLIRHQDVVQFLHN